MITALVVNYGTPEDLWMCVSTAERFDERITWVLYDNAHPQRKSTDMLMSLQNRLGPRARVIESSENRGHGYGINRAAELAAAEFKSEFFFVLNPDCEWREPVLDPMVQYLRENEDCILVGPKQLDQDMKITAGGIIGEPDDPKHRHWKAHDPKNERCRDVVADCPTVSGSAMLVRAEPFLELGGMLEAGHYYSETWLCYHARAHGWKCAYYGPTWMIHKWHRSSAMGSPESDGRFAVDQKLFREKCDEHDPPIVRD